MPKFFKQKGSVYLIIALVSLGIGVAATFIKSTPVQAPAVNEVVETTLGTAPSADDEGISSDDGGIDSTNDTPPTVDLSKLLEAAQAEPDPFNSGSDTKVHPINPAK